MLRLIVRRFAVSVPLLIGVCSLTFVLLEAAPGRPVDLLLGDRPMPPEQRKHLEAAYGLDRPPLARYLEWIGRAATGDLGWSLSRGRPVARVLADALPATAGLAAAALALQLALGLILGTLHAVRPHGLADQALGAAGWALAAAPPFWLGLMAILAFSYYIPIFPPSSSHSVGVAESSLSIRVADTLWHVALPAIVLGVGAAAVLARFLRAGLFQTLRDDFIRAARARGAAPARVLVVHALRASLSPVITIAGLSLPGLVSGSLVIEVVFGWPGMGRATYDAILAQDLPVALAAVALSTALVVVGNLVADLGVAWADPRVRLPSTGRP